MTDDDITSRSAYDASRAATRGLNLDPARLSAEWEARGWPPEPHQSRRTRQAVLVVAVILIAAVAVAF